MLVQVQVLDRRFGFAGAAAVLMLVQVQVLALDRRFGFAGAAVLLMLVLDRRFDFAGAGAVLVQALALDWLCVMPGMTLCHAQNDIMSCQGGHHVMPGHVRPRMASRQGRHHVTPGMTCCHSVHDTVLCVVQQ